MKIIQPAHNKISKRVKSYRSIKKEAVEILEYIKKGNFEGNHSEAYAISQVQVSDDPKSYFILNPKINKGELVKTFGHWCIVNLKIIKKEHECLFPEGCMSFPFREPKKVARYEEIVATYWTPFLGLFLIPRRKKLKDLYAFIAQHEYDHSLGINIYKKYKNEY